MEDCNESSLHLDYGLMAQSSALADIIRETALQIEENMITPNQKPIDMNLIEILKQRRKSQLRGGAEVQESLNMPCIMSKGSDKAWKDVK